MKKNRNIFYIVISAMLLLSVVASGCGRTISHNRPPRPTSSSKPVRPTETEPPVIATRPAATEPPVVATRPAATEPPVVATTAPALPIPPEAEEFNGHYYCVYHVTQALSWAEAKEYCESVGGYLATLTSKAESDFAYSLLREKGRKAGSFGLSNVRDQDQWEWVTGEAFSYSNWAEGEPNNTNGFQHYGAFNKDFAGDQWHDAASHCDTFICEWGDFLTAEEQTQVDKTPVPLG